MVRIVWGPLRCSFDPYLSPFLTTVVDDLLSCYQPGYRFSKLYKAHKWDGKKHFLWAKKQKFPTGFLLDVEKALRVCGEKVKIVGAVPPSPVSLVTELLDGKVLRPYQIDAAQAFLTNPHRRGVLRVPTAGGKTALLAAITKSMGCQTLGLIHGNSLLDQTFNDFKDHLGEGEIGLIGNGQFDVRRFTLSSVDTVFARLKNEDPEIGVFLANVDFVWCDEVHRASAMSWVEILKAIPTPYRLGVSGTPFKKQELADMELRAWTGPMLYDISPSLLQEQGYLSQAELSIIEIQGERSTEKNWHAVVQRCIVDNEARNCRVGDVAIKRAQEGKFVFLLAGNSLALARWYYDYIAEVFPGVELVTGKSGVGPNREALRRFKEGASRIIVATTVLDEGINAPDTSVVILANTGKSYVKLMQRIGRGLRIKADEGKALEVVDVMDNTHKYLAKHARVRLDYYEEEGLFGRVTVL